MGKNSGRSKRAKKAALEGPQPKYPVEFAKPCVDHQKGTADQQAHIRAVNAAMVEVLETLYYTDGNKDYCHTIGRAFNSENPSDIVSGIRLLKGEIEVFNGNVTLSREWSLDQQMEYVKCLIASHEDDLKRAELEDECGRIQCVIRQLSSIVAKVEKGKFDAVMVAGTTIKKFVSPPAEEGKAWADALKKRIAELKDQVKKGMEEAEFLKDKDEKYSEEDVVRKMMDEAGAISASMKAHKSTNVDMNDSSESVLPDENDAPEKEGSIMCYAEYVTVETRFGRRRTSASKKTKGKTRAVPYKGLEKIIVISVHKSPVYEEAVYDGEDSSSCGDTDGKGTSSEEDTNGKESSTEKDLGGKKTGGILTGSCAVSRRVPVMEVRNGSKKKEEETGQCPVIETHNGSKKKNEETRKRPVIEAPGTGNRQQRSLDSYTSDVLTLIVVFVLFIFLCRNLKALVVKFLEAFGSSMMNFEEQ